MNNEYVIMNNDCVRPMGERLYAFFLYLFIIHSSLFISACGFTPMHAPSNRLAAETADIYIAPISGTNGIDLRNQLIVAWDANNYQGAKYTLRVNLRPPETILKGRQRTGDATWEEVRIRASWSLYQEDMLVARSIETASESYIFVADMIAANASRIRAQQNAVQMIGERIEMKVNAKLATGRGPMVERTLDDINVAAQDPGSSAEFTR